MSKDNFFRFIMLTDLDKDLKKKYEEIMDKCKFKTLTKGNWDKVIKEELIPLAKENGFEFSLEDMKEQEKPTYGEISDDDLEQVAGGRAEYTHTYNFGKGDIRKKYSCEFASDESTFELIFNLNSRCPNYSERVSAGVSCSSCNNLKYLGNA